VSRAGRALQASSVAAFAVLAGAALTGEDAPVAAADGPGQQSPQLPVGDAEPALWHHSPEEGTETKVEAAATRLALLRARAVQERRERTARAARAAQRRRIELAREKADREANRWVRPLAGYRMTSGYGARWGRQHAGVDLAAPIGTRVGALSGGTVVFAGTQSGYGMKVEIRHRDGTVSWYAHMSAITVSVGQAVAPGDQVGRVGNTGRSTGPHLHLEIHPAGGDAVSAMAFLAQRGLQL
jgi:murein DD-endopeptidase MepM/ murein hydrolase activator NlpD